MGGKTKSRFDGIDVAAMTAYVKRSLLGHKLANVYDGIAMATSMGDSSAKGTFLFKLANPSANSAQKSPDQSDDKTKVSSSATTAAQTTNRSMLLIESGVRFHTTTFYASGDSTSSSTTPPSPFAMKLRKHLRNLRLENITQLGNLDRVVDFRFGSGQNSHHLIVELYGLGNIILTTDKYVILGLLRLHEYDTATADTVGGGNDKDTSRTEQVKVRVGNVYPVTYATTITSQNDDQLSKSSLLDMDGNEASEWATRQLQSYVEKAKVEMYAENDSNANQKGKKKKKKKKDNDGSISLKMLLLKPNSGVFHYGPALIEHCILCAKLEPNTKFSIDTIEKIMPPSLWEGLISSLRVEGSQILDNLNNGDGSGYLLYRKKDQKIDEEEKERSDETNALHEAIQKMPHSDKIFEEFQPQILQQHKDRASLTYDNFSLAVDEFYSLLEGQKRGARAEAAEQAAKDRLEKIRKDQSKRMEALETEMIKVKEHAELVETHADDVDKAIGVISSGLESGMDWESLNELVEVEKANMNPIALLIKNLVLDKETIVLSLPDTMNWDQDSDAAPPIVDVTVSLTEGAYANARIMYDKYRASKEKSIKTAEASEKAFKAAEINAQRAIEQAQTNKKMTYSVMMQPQRKQHWFEKFHWFITSDNYIVIGGRDAQQNEQLVKRYLRPGDAYLHADVHGAPTCILRAKRRRTSKGSTEVLPLSDQALREAGNFAICKSSAWKSRMITSAWWVESHQVSKTAPTGEYLTVGSFMIRGRKNFLPPTPLEMGLGVLFRLGDDVSIARHVHERRDFALMALQDQDKDDHEMNVTNTATKSSKVKKSHPTYDRLLGSNGDLSSFVRAESKSKSTQKEKDNNNANDSTVDIEKHTESCDNKSSVTKETAEESNIDVENGLKHIEEEVKPSKRKGYSARERRLIKKYGSIEVAEKTLSELKLQEEERLANKKDLGETQKPSNIPKPVVQPRGKKAKMKKIAKKYADQDEEDRELALQALQGSQKEKRKGRKNVNIQSTAGQAHVAAETQALLVRDSQEVVHKLPKEVREILEKCLIGNSGEETIPWNKLDAEILEQLIGLDSEDAKIAAVNRLLQLVQKTRIDNYSASLSGIIRTVNKWGHEGILLEEAGNESKQRKTKAEKFAENEAWREILAEDGIIEVDPDANEGTVDDTAEISKLTGKPLPGDVILYAIPVCAPYAVLAQFKYRVKLTPGSGKRGKASKQCVEMFYRTEDQSKNRSTNNQNDKFISVIKAVSDNEWVQAICGDVKISAAGASKAIKKQKSRKKKH